MKKIALLVNFILILIPLVISAQDSDEPRLALGSLDWSPDGTELIFSAMLVMPDYSNFRPELWQLYRYQLATKKLEILESTALFASYSPDGNRIAYGQMADDNWEIFVKDLNNGKSQRLTDNEFKDNAPTWSPDGNRLVFNSDRDGNYEIFVMNADGSGIVQVTKTDTVKSYNPEWSPNDNRIVYYQETGNRMDQIYLTDSRGSFFRNLTDDQNHNFYPSWASENQIVFTRMDSGFYTIATDGSEKTKLEGAAGFYIKKASGRPVFAILNPEEEAILLYNSESKEIEKLLDKNDIANLNSE